MRIVIEMLSLGALSAYAAPRQAKPTYVLVHGALDESSSRIRVIAELNKRGFRAIAAANPRRSFASDAAAMSAIVRSVAGLVVLVGHSYGGPVITEAANDNPNAKALVHVTGLAPDSGESRFTLSAKFPGSMPGDAIVPEALCEPL